jgi:hypothetical protein
MQKRGLSLIVAAATMLVTAGCGGGSGAVTAPNTPKQLAADKALAKQAVLKLSDLPAGYKGSPHSDSGDDLPPAVERTFLACTHLPKSFIDDKSRTQPSADAPDFTKGEVGAGAASEVDSSVEIDRSSNDIKEPLSHLTGSTAADCFTPFFKAVFKQAVASEPSVTLGPVSVVALDFGGIGDQSSAFQGRVKISGPSRAIDFEFDFYFVRTGRAGVTMAAIGYDSTFDQTLARSLLKTVVSRLKAAS